MAETGTRQAEHHDGKEARHEGAGARIAGKETVQVAGCAVIVAENEPRKIIQDVMPSRSRSISVQQPVGKQANRTCAQNGVAGRIHAALDEGPRIADDDTQHQS